MADQMPISRLRNFKADIGKRSLEGPHIGWLAVHQRTIQIADHGTNRSTKLGRRISAASKGRSGDRLHLHRCRSAGWRLWLRAGAGSKCETFVGKLPEIAP